MELGPATQQQFLTPMALEEAAIKRTKSKAGLAAVIAELIVGCSMVGLSLIRYIVIFVFLAEMKPGVVIPYDLFPLFVASVAMGGAVVGMIGYRNSSERLISFHYTWLFAICMTLDFLLICYLLLVRFWVNTTNSHTRERLWRDGHPERPYETRTLILQGLETAQISAVPIYILVLLVLFCVIRYERRQQMLEMIDIAAVQRKQIVNVVSQVNDPTALGNQAPVDAPLKNVVKPEGKLVDSMTTVDSAEMSQQSSQS